MTAESPSPQRRRGLGQWSTVIDLDERPVLIAEDELAIWIVEAGALDVFAVTLRAGEPRGRWMPVCRLDRGSILATRSAVGAAYTLAARAAADSRISRALPDDFRAIVGDIGGLEGSSIDPLEFAKLSAQFARGVDATLSALANALHATLPPRTFTPLSTDEYVPLEQGSSARSIAGIRWTTVERGSINLGVDRPDHSFTSGQTVCLSERDWAVAERDTVLVPRPTIALMRDHSIWNELATNASWLGATLDHHVATQLAAERAAAGRMRNLTSEAQRRLEETLIPSLLTHDIEGKGSAPERGVLGPAQSVAQSVGVELLVPDAVPPGEALEAVRRAAHASGIGTRTVRLEGHWWNKEHGPLVGAIRSGDATVALLPQQHGYVCEFPLGTEQVKVDRDVSLRIGSDALALYRSVPDEVSTVVRLLRWGSRGAGRDLATFVVAVVLSVLLGLVVPVLTGTILGTWVALGQRSLVIQGSVFIMVSALAIGALGYVQNAAILRLQGRIELDAQAAVWDRLLSLPASFFRRFAAADLGTAALGISTMREVMSNVVAASLVAATTALLDSVLVFVYNVKVGLVLTAFVVVWTMVYLACWRRALRVQREAYATERRLSSLVFQLLSAVTTLRVAAAEDRAYSRWFEGFLSLRALVAKVRRTQAVMTCVNALVIPVATLGVFWLAAGPLSSELSTAQFLTVLTVVTIVVGSLMQLFGSSLAIVEVVPNLEEVAPILATMPEAATATHEPVELEGHIELRNVSFRYSDDGPWVLDDVSFDVKPGEFAAIVGPTGSGKSTILRLLLGFERPHTGAVVYDDHDLSQLDITSVRQECGVVLQGGSLLPGTILLNITGGSGHSLDDAWRAARLAGIADDIEALPMGMHTFVSEGAATFSGGQVQRIMIARALVSSPRIVYFDEATSALDNESQRVVTESTHQLNASRVVIAHRLSTIQLADKIVVLKDGKVVQQGTYATLVADRDGEFATLVGRQLLSGDEGPDGEHDDTLSRTYTFAELEEMRKAAEAEQEAGPVTDGSEVSATCTNEAVAFCSALIRIDTTNTGDPETTRGERLAADFVFERVVAVGHAPELVEPEPGRTSVVVRVPGRDPDRPALLVHGHLDVVPANPDSWSMDPFSGAIRDGCVWGRGAVDMKGFVATTVAVLREWERAGRKPSRDIVFAWVADEEAGGHAGARWLCRERPDLFVGTTEAIGEVGGFGIPTSPEVTLYPIMTGEKGYAWATLTTRSRAGHASSESDGNAVAELVRVLARIDEEKFPAVLNEPTKDFLKHVGSVFGNDLMGLPIDEALDAIGPLRALVGPATRTTVTPTQLRAGTYVNTIPDEATASLDCRFVDGSVAELRARLSRVVGNDAELTWTDTGEPLRIPFDGPLVQQMGEALRRHDPTARTVPYMVSAATDAQAFSSLGIRCYGFSPLRLPVTLPFGSLFHGVDERVPISSLVFGARVLHDFLLDA